GAAGDLGAVGEPVAIRVGLQWVSAAGDLGAVGEPVAVVVGVAYVALAVPVGVELVRVVVGRAVVVGVRDAVAIGPGGMWLAVDEVVHHDEVVGGVLGHAGVHPGVPG